MKTHRIRQLTARFVLIGIAVGTGFTHHTHAGEVQELAPQMYLVPSSVFKPVRPTDLTLFPTDGITPLIDVPGINSDGQLVGMDIDLSAPVVSNEAQESPNLGYPLQTEDLVVDDVIHLTSDERFDPSVNPWFEWDDGTMPLEEEYPWEEVGLKTTRIKVTAKSYIAPIGNNVGNVPGGNNGVLNLLAGVTDRFFSENPINDRMDHAYRLFSSVVMVVTCDGNTLVNWAHTPYLDDTGTEPPKPIVNLAALQAPPGVLREEVTDPVLNTKGNFTRVNNSTLRIDWAFYGRPHAFAEPPLAAVARRTGKWIWHRVDGFVTCVNDVAVPRINVSGSGFPSHRLWINRVLRQTLPQGPFSNLWVNGGEVLDTKGKSYAPKVFKVK